jgi:hypothetical protein
MKPILCLVCVGCFLYSCDTKSNADNAEKTTASIDTLQYAYKATYSSDVTVPSHPEYAQKVLTVWKMFEKNQIDSMKQFYADTVTYDGADGSRFHGSSNDLLNFARKDVESLDSLRFDLSTWQSVHINDKNEDWVYVWAAERRYDKKGKADTTLIHEQWKIVNNKISYFNQYLSKKAK